VLRSRCQNSGNISLIRIACHRKNYAQPWAEAEQAPQLSRRISPGGTHKLVLRRAMLFTTDSTGDVVCSEEYIKVHLGEKQAGDKQPFSFQ